MDELLIKAGLSLINKRFRRYKIDTDKIIDALKRELKAKSLTYKDVAEALKLSEASIKRSMTSQDLTLQRLSDLCRVAGTSLAQIISRVTQDASSVTLTVEQEAQLANDIDLLKLIFFLRRGKTHAEIAKTFQFDPSTLQQKLLILDKMKVIELHPESKVKHLHSLEVQFIPGGPMETFIKEHARQEFLQADFTNPESAFYFVYFELTEEDRHTVADELLRLKSLVYSLGEKSRDSKATKQWTGVMVAARPFIFSKFKSR